MARSRRSGRRCSDNVASVSHRLRENVLMQCVSQVLPPSPELACSQRADREVFCDHCTRVVMLRPSSVSSPIKVPMPSANDPRSGDAIAAGSRPERESAIAAVRQIHYVVVESPQAIHREPESAFAVELLPFIVARSSGWLAVSLGKTRECSVGISRLPQARRSTRPMMPGATALTTERLSCRLNQTYGQCSAAPSLASVRAFEAASDRNAAHTFIRTAVVMQP